MARSFQFPAPRGALAFLLSTNLFTGICLPASDWPCFRGPCRTGISADKGLPLEWSDAKNIIWKTALPGPGASSPITFSNHIYVTCYSGYGVNRESPGDYEKLTRHLVCLDAQNGRILWNVARPNQAADDRYGDYINRHGYASSTPAADATGVYVFYGTSGVGAYSHDGKLRWEKSCGTRYQNFGSASSPIIFGDLVIVNADIEGSGIVALDKSTGREVWRVPTASNARSTPFVVPVDKAFELVFHLKGSFNNNSKEGKLAAVAPRNWRQIVGMSGIGQLFASQSDRGGRIRVCHWELSRMGRCNPRGGTRRCHDDS